VNFFPTNSPNKTVCQLQRIQIAFTAKYVSTHKHDLKDANTILIYSSDVVAIMRKLFRSSQSVLVETHQSQTRGSDSPPHAIVVECQTLLVSVVEAEHLTAVSANGPEDGRESQVPVRQ